MINEKEFLIWYDKYADKLFRYCLYRVYDREQAKDLAQQVFLKAWEYLVQEKTVDSPQAFLYRIATNLIIDSREKKQAVSLDELVEQGHEPTKTEEHEWINCIEVKEIICLIQSLDPIHRDVLLMRYVDELKPKEIAKIMNESQNVISVRIHRGKAELQSLLKQKQDVPQNSAI